MHTSRSERRSQRIYSKSALECVGTLASLFHRLLFHHFINVLPKVPPLLKPADRS